MQSAITKTEFLFIHIFRWVVIVGLTVLLLASIWLGAKAVLTLPRAAKEAEPLKAAPALVVSFDEWLADNRPREPVEKETVTKSLPSKNSALDAEGLKAEHADDPKFSAQANALWPIVAEYQKACQTIDPLTRDAFMDSLRQTDFGRALSDRPDEYATSQVAFVKEALGSPETIKLCLSGKTGTFLSVLKFHRMRYDSHVTQKKYFEDAERNRIMAFAAAQERERVRKFGEAKNMLMLAASVFGVFLGLTLLLIFARIEVNLRAIASKQ